MIGQWMLYGVALAAVVSVMTVAAEYALRLYGRATRWLWATSVVAALVLPLLAWVFTTPQAPAAVGGLGDVASATVVASPMPAASAPAPSLWSRATRLEGRLDGKLPWVCLGASLLAALGLALSYVRLRRQRGQWREAQVDGVRVLISDGTGPAVVGLRRGRIVVPAWVLEEPEARRRLILAHEAEHLAAGDARLLTGALAAIVAAPWNPLVWWQIRRLRLATEVDCDARVVRRRGDLRGYAGLLLDVGMRFGEGGVLAAFAEPRSLLARRLRALTAPLPGRRGWRVALAATGGIAVAALACVAPSPDKPLPSEPVGRAQAVAADTAGPHDTPYTVAPEMANREEVVRALLELYPHELRNAGIGGHALIWLHIDRTGQVMSSRIQKTSGRAELDSAAVRLGRVMRFTPARNGSAPTDIWIGLPVVFTPKGGGKQTPASPQASTAAARQDTFDVAPRLTNSAEVNAAIDPATWRRLNVRSVFVGVHVDESGRVSDVRVRRSVSPEADSLAVRRMRFTPALRQGRPVAAWVEAGPRPRPTPEQIRQGPVFTPYTVAPELINREEVRAALVREYPPELKAAGVGGTIQIWLLLDESGRTLQARVKRGSGYTELDSAAVRVGRVLRFTPARSEAKPVEAWIQLPIIFKASGAPAAPPLRSGAQPAADTQATAQAVAAQATAPVPSPQPKKRKKGIAAIVASWFVPVIAGH